MLNDAIYFVLKGSDYSQEHLWTKSPLQETVKPFPVDRVKCLGSTLLTTLLLYLPGENIMSIVDPDNQKPYRALEYTSSAIKRSLMRTRRAKASPTIVVTVVAVLFVFVQPHAYPGVLNLFPGTAEGAHGSG